MFGDTPQKNPKAEDKEKKLIHFSMLLPGVYQMKSGKWFKGSVLLAAFAATVAGAIIENKKGNDSYDLYLKAIDVNEVLLLRQESEDHFKSRNTFLCGMVVVGLFHLLDLKLFNKQKKNPLKSQKNSVTANHKTSLIRPADFSRNTLDSPSHFTIKNSFNKNSFNLGLYYSF